MQSNSTPTLAGVIREARQQRGISTRGLSEKVGLDQSGIVRLEAGSISSPKPAVLSAIAETLDLDLADLYALAGYTRPSDLPAFTPYLRSKFADMPAAAQAELEASFRTIADKYGFDPDGPLNGEDEH
ncbi:helix-turn-helix transcriptional regulator [Curtobacterium sp. MCBD17_019]|uniref:helix-turn-helix domain-containing protein n=1 Tax=Curtobacterium sp. MCBD17_019 TaxID=2175669 RepID=UPI000DA77481|nr:helix-turn-helix transcriptional regulator [Curtobacterium sp. MCBD17_019]PZE75342.1 hypothetical protein DEI82_08345 [Curtobacterium sp. MCBD17_019]